MKSEAADKDFRRQNIRKAHQAWMAMSPEQRKRRPVFKNMEPDPEPPRQRKPGQMPRPRPDFGGDAIAYYHRHYAGLTRGQLQNEHQVLYRHLQDWGLLDQIPLKSRVSFPDPLAYYQEHCAGMTRKQASLAEPQFYGYLQRNRLLTSIPFAPAAGAVTGGRDTRWQETFPVPSLPRRSAEPAGESRRQDPSLAAARLECFRIIPE